MTLTCDLCAFACLSKKCTLWSSGLDQEEHVQSPDPSQAQQSSHSRARVTSCFCIPQSYREARCEPKSDRALRCEWIHFVVVVTFM